MLDSLNRALALKMSLLITSKTYYLLIFIYSDQVFTLFFIKICYYGHES